MRHGSFQGRRNNNRHGGRGGGHGGGGHGGGNQRQSQGSGNQRPHRNQIFDSNGPDVRVRGTAFQINEKYLTLAKDAASSGDPILAENYLQHAEHYQRIINEFEPANTGTQPRFERNEGEGGASDDNEGEASQQQQQQQPQSQQSADPGEAPQPSAEGARVVRRERKPKPERTPSEDGADLGLPSSLFAGPTDDGRESA